MKTDLISFCMSICSRRRPDLLTRAIESILANDIPENVQFSILILENDDKPQYAKIVDSFKHRVTVHYVTEPKPGLTYGRNKIFTTAIELGVDWLGSIDDDVEITDDWLEHMVSAIRNYPDTDLFYGNWVRTQHPDAPAWHPRPRLINQAKTGKKIRVSSFNNIAIKSSVFAPEGMGLSFDHQFRFTGGEDTDFTQQYLNAKGTLRSVFEAQAFEEINDDRASFTKRLQAYASTEYAMAKIRHKYDFWLVAAFWSLQSMYRFGVLGVFNIVLGFLALPFNQLWGLKRYGQGRRMLACARGVLRYYFGSEPSPYRDKASE